MEREVAEMFLGKFCGIVRLDNGRDFFCRGRITKITEQSIILEFEGKIQAIAIDSVKNIRILGDKKEELC